MAINKVIYGNDTLIDLTSDTVSANSLLSGETAHDRSGTVIQGTVTVPDDLNDLSDVDISSTTDGQALLYDDTIDKWVNGDIQITESQVTNLITDLSNKIGKTQLTNEVLRNITEEGFYYADTGNSCTDKPSDCSSGEAFGLLVVKVGNSDIYQIYFRNNTFNLNGTMYKRTGTTSGIWPYLWTRMYFSNTHRPINVNGTELLGDNSTAVNFIDGTNTTVVGSGSDIQINAADKDKMDWVSNGILGAKNLNSTPYYHASRTINYVTWTINADGSVTANGTASGGNSNFACHSRNMELNKLVLPNGNYILSGCAAGGSSTTWEISLERTYNGSAETIATNQSGDTEFTLNGDDYSADCVQVQLILRVRNNQQANNITFYPMIRLANDTDATWTPYAETNKELTDNKVSWVENGLIGAKNLNSYPYYNTTKSSANVVWTDMGDGTVKAHGLANANSSFACHLRQPSNAYPLILPNGTYKFTGCASGGSTTTYRVDIGITKNGAYQELGKDIGDGVEFTVNGDDYYTDRAYIQISLIVISGYNAQNLMFKPMIRVAEDNDNTYQPYAPTNRDLQLTKPNPEAIATVEYSPTRANHSQGDLIMFNGNLYKCLSAITSGSTLVAGTNIQQTDLVTEILAMISAL